jgi:hypothetical protein
MALRPCQGCGKQVDTTAAACPGCGRPKPTAVPLGLGWRVASWALIGVAVVFMVKTCASSDDEPSSSAAPSRPSAPSLRPLTGIFENSINRQVVDDAVREYDIAKRNGTKIDACVHAGFVSAAYLQAKDEEGYQRAKATEKADCRRAGVPQ